MHPLVSIQNCPFCSLTKLFFSYEVIPNSNPWRTISVSSSVLNCTFLRHVEQKNKGKAAMSKTKKVYIIYKAQRLLMSTDACMVVRYRLSPVCRRRADLSISCFRWRVCSVSATPLDFRMYACWAVCLRVMFQSFSVQFVQVLQFNSFRDFRQLLRNPATSAKSRPSSALGVSPPHPWEFRAWAGRWHLNSSWPFVLFRTFPAWMGCAAGWAVTLSGNCPADNADGLPSLSSRQEFLRVQAQKGHI